MTNASSFLLGAITAGLAAMALFGLGRHWEGAAIPLRAAPPAETDDWFIG